MKERDKHSLLNIIAEWREIKFCGPSDDPDIQTAVTYAFIHLVKSFKYFGSRIEDTKLRMKVREIRSDINNIYDVYEVNSDAYPVLVDVENYLSEGDYEVQPLNSDAYIDKSIIDELGQLKNPNFDMKKILRFCEEINFNYMNRNWISVTLLIRALINHIPPIFGFRAFNQVVSNSSRSVKELLAPLDETLRDIADLHTHNLIRKKESLPTEKQIEPFKANLEVLLQEIICKLEE